MVGVSDGDTITVLDDSKFQHKVRIAGIDAPETTSSVARVERTTVDNVIRVRHARVTQQGRRWTR